jgi:hypothetical protein
MRCLGAGLCRSADEHALRMARVAAQAGLARARALLQPLVLALDDGDDGVDQRPALLLLQDLQGTRTSHFFTSAA